MPVSERTYWASNSAFSRAPRRPVSSSEKMMMPAKARGIEKIAGLDSGSKAFWVTSLHLPAPAPFQSTTMTTEEINPIEPPPSAPSVVGPRHRIDITRTGKLQLAATAKASPTRPSC